MHYYCLTQLIPLLILVPIFLSIPCFLDRLSAALWKVLRGKEIALLMGEQQASGQMACIAAEKVANRYGFFS